MSETDGKCENCGLEFRYYENYQHHMRAAHRITGKWKKEDFEHLKHMQE
jgi:uncharacterized C2H2 Zn-finger protein